MQEQNQLQRRWAGVSVPQRTILAWKRHSKAPPCRKERDKDGAPNHVRSTTLELRASSLAPLVKARGFGMTHLICGLDHRFLTDGNVRPTNARAKPISKATDGSIRATKNDLGVEESAGNSCGDGEEFALAIENLHLAGLREFGEVDGASGADATGGW